MTSIETTTVDLLDGTLTLIEFCSHAQLPRQHVIDMIDAGVLDPIGYMTSPDEQRFAARDLRRARISRRLMNDLGIQLDSVAIIVDLIEQRDDLQRRVALLERMLER
jgi:chaperone modulatory protein CbpM